MELLAVVIASGILGLLLKCAVLSGAKSTRIRYAIASFAWVALVFVVAGEATRFNYNIWYSAATKRLIGASIKGWEEGRSEEVLGELRSVHEELDVTYEKRGNYLGLSAKASQRLEQVETK